MLRVTPGNSGADLPNLARAGAVTVAPAQLVATVYPLVSSARASHSVVGSLIKKDRAGGEVDDGHADQSYAAVLARGNAEPQQPPLFLGEPCIHSAGASIKDALASPAQLEELRTRSQESNVRISAAQLPPTLAELRQVLIRCTPTPAAAAMPTDIAQLPHYAVADPARAHARVNGELHRIATEAAAAPDAHDPALLSALHALVRCRMHYASRYSELMHSADRHIEQAAADWLRISHIVQHRLLDEDVAPCPHPFPAADIEAAMRVLSGRAHATAACSGDLRWIDVTRVSTANHVPAGQSQENAAGLHPAFIEHKGMITLPRYEAGTVGVHSVTCAACTVDVYADEQHVTFGPNGTASSAAAAGAGAATGGDHAASNEIRSRSGGTTVSFNMRTGAPAGQASFSALVTASGSLRLHTCPLHELHQVLLMVLLAELEELHRRAVALDKVDELRKMTDRRVDDEQITRDINAADALATADQATAQRILREADQHRESVLRERSANQLHVNDIAAAGRALHAEFLKVLELVLLGVQLNLFDEVDDATLVAHALRKCVCVPETRDACKTVGAGGATNRKLLDLVRWISTTAIPMPGDDAAVARMKRAFTGSRSPRFLSKAAPNEACCGALIALLFSNAIPQPCITATFTHLGDALPLLVPQLRAMGSQASSATGSSNHMQTEQSVSFGGGDLLGVDENGGVMMFGDMSQSEEQQQAAWRMLLDVASSDDALCQTTHQFCSSGHALEASVGFTGATGVPWHCTSCGKQFASDTQFENRHPMLRCARCDEHYCLHCMTTPDAFCNSQYLPGSDPAAVSSSSQPQQFWRPIGPSWLLQLDSHVLFYNELPNARPSARLALVSSLREHEVVCDVINTTSSPLTLGIGAIYRNNEWHHFATLDGVLCWVKPFTAAQVDAAIAHNTNFSNYMPSSPAGNGGSRPSSGGGGGARAAGGGNNVFPRVYPVINNFATSHVVRLGAPFQFNPLVVHPSRQLQRLTPYHVVLYILRSSVVHLGLTSRELTPGATFGPVLEPLAERVSESLALLLAEDETATAGVPMSSGGSGPAPLSISAISNTQAHALRQSHRVLLFDVVLPLLTAVLKICNEAEKSFEDPEDERWRPQQDMFDALMALGRHPSRIDMDAFSGALAETLRSFPGGNGAVPAAALPAYMELGGGLWRQCVNSGGVRIDTKPLNWVHHDPQAHLTSTTICSMAGNNWCIGDMLPIGEWAFSVRVHQNGIEVGNAFPQDVLIGITVDETAATLLAHPQRDAAAFLNHANTWVINQRRRPQQRHMIMSAEIEVYFYNGEVIDITHDDRGMLLFSHTIAGGPESASVQSSHGALGMQLPVPIHAESVVGRRFRPFVFCVDPDVTVEIIGTVENAVPLTDDSAFNSMRTLLTSTDAAAQMAIGSMFRTGTMDRSLRSIQTLLSVVGTGAPAMKRLCDHRTFAQFVFKQLAAFVVANVRPTAPQSGQLSSELGVDNVGAVGAAMLVLNEIAGRYPDWFLTALDFERTPSAEQLRTPGALRYDQATKDAVSVDARGLFTEFTSRLQALAMMLGESGHEDDPDELVALGAAEAFADSRSVRLKLPFANLDHLRRTFSEPLKCARCNEPYTSPATRDCPHPLPTYVCEPWLWQLGVRQNIFNDTWTHREQQDANHRGYELACDLEIPEPHDGPLRCTGLTMGRWAASFVNGTRQANVLEWEVRIDVGQPRPVAPAEPSTGGGGGGAQQQQEAPTEWSCPVCTYINNPTAPACSMCTTANPNPPSAGGGGGGGGGGAWSCSVCTFEHEGPAPRCQICGNPAPESVLSQMADHGLGPDGGPVPEGQWRCYKCTFFNPEARAQCEACGEAKPAEPVRLVCDTGHEKRLQPGDAFAMAPLHCDECGRADVRWRLADINAATSTADQQQQFLARRTLRFRCELGEDGQSMRGVLAPSGRDQIALRMTRSLERPDGWAAASKQFALPPNMRVGENARGLRYNNHLIPAAAGLRSITSVLFKNLLTKVSFETVDARLSPQEASMHVANMLMHSAELQDDAELTRMLAKLRVPADVEAASLAGASGLEGSVYHRSRFERILSKLFLTKVNIAYGVDVLSGVSASGSLGASPVSSAGGGAAGSRPGSATAANAVQTHPGADWNAILGSPLLVRLTQLSRPQLLLSAIEAAGLTQEAAGGAQQFQLPARFNDLVAVTQNRTRFDWAMMSIGGMPTTATYRFVKMIEYGALQTSGAGARVPATIQNSEGNHQMRLVPNLTLALEKIAAAVDNMIDVGHEIGSVVGAGGPLLEEIRKGSSPEELALIVPSFERDHNLLSEYAHYVLIADGINQIQVEVMSPRNRQLLSSFNEHRRQRRADDDPSNRLRKYIADHLYQACPRCGDRMTKDDACNHVSHNCVIDGQRHMTQWCFGCGRSRMPDATLKCQDLGRACAGNVTYLHGRDWIGGKMQEWGNTRWQHAFYFIRGITLLEWFLEDFPANDRNDLLEQRDCPLLRIIEQHEAGFLAGPLGQRILDEMNRKLSGRERINNLTAVTPDPLTQSAPISAPRRAAVWEVLQSYVAQVREVRDRVFPAWNRQTI